MERSSSIAVIATADSPRLSTSELSAGSCPCLFLAGKTASAYFTAAVAASC